VRHSRICKAIFVACGGFIEEEDTGERIQVCLHHTLQNEARRAAREAKEWLEEEMQGGGGADVYIEKTRRSALGKRASRTCCKPSESPMRR